MAGSTEPYTDGSIITAAGQNSAHWRVYTEQGLNHIRQLIDRAGIYSTGNIGGWGEAYVDVDGQNDSVDTGSTTATFDANKYRLPGLDSTATSVTSSNTFSSSSQTTTVTLTFSCLKDFFISSVAYAYITGQGDTTIDITIKKNGGTIYTKTGVAVPSSGSSGSKTNTLDYADYTGYLESGDTGQIILSCTNSIRYAAGYNSETNDFLSFASQTYAIGGTGGFSYNMGAIGCKSIDNTEALVYHDIPSGTFSDTVSSAIGVPFIADWETGADIQYKLTNTGGDDSGWLDAMDTSPEVSSFTAFTSEPTSLIVKLIPKTTSPTGGYPSVKGIYINAWSD